MTALASRLHPERIRRTLGAATCVKESARFTVNELARRPSKREYRLRESGLRIEARHPLLDMWVIEEMFRFRTYELPAQVKAVLSQLGRPLRIVDLGGHVGCFALFILDLYPDASVISFEPDPGNADMLERCIVANGLQDNWSLVRACAATSNGVAELVSDFHLSTAAARSDPPLREMHRRILAAFPFMERTALVEPNRRDVARRDVFPFLVAADLVKIDIEGGEWELLGDPRFDDLSAASVVLEYHPLYCDGDAEQILRDTLGSAGYRTTRPLRAGDAGMVWAWKPPDGS